MSRSNLPLNGPFHHEEIPRRDIASVKVKLARARYLVTDMTQNAPTGSDDAAEAGYHSENRSRSETMMLAKECQAIVEASRSLQAETDQNITAIRDIQRVRATQASLTNSPGHLRREAAAQVLKHLTGSRDGLRSLIRQVASDASPEVRDAVTEALARATDSQAERWITGAQQAPEVATLQQTIKDKDTELSLLKGEIETKRKANFAFQRDRHQAETNLISEKAKVAAFEKQLKRTKEQLDSAQERIGALEEELRLAKLSGDWYQSQAELLHEAHRDAEDEKETLAFHLSQHNQSVANLRQQLASDAQHAQAEQALMETELENSISKLEAAKTETKDVTQRLDRAERRLAYVEVELTTAQKDLASSRQEIDDAAIARTGLEKKISKQRASLVSQATEIGQLNSLITARGETIDSQIDQASVFLRRMSLDMESDIWRRVAEGVLTDSTVAPAAPIPWQPWRVLPSWSHDEALDVQEDDRSIHSLAVDIAAIMKVPSAPAEPLLSRLQSLQDLMVDKSPLVPTVSQILLESLAGAVGDERLHLMHHVLVCQIAILLCGNGVELNEVILDPRATALVSALGAWDPESGPVLNLACSLSYPEVALVGFNHSPRGIIAASPLNRELLWVDEAQIDNTLTHIELSSEKVGTIALPLDTRERQLWAVAHL
ncbi:uncharacterized protein FPRO_10341 [Fusarium proliferatum ET1]|uniref:Uncharacterized protein n=1 Tax=Fusarium proliferatum (strain ET1) TaxID=1227346 RepID=A0A1L7VJK2_FUSPR|nr:uncharacterized protein FPRO_10341 [Fusarium proliferatum ET1]CZR40753.1 uncharacterized protein FPRO_10341 [Fusarium proliferatum ET1]